MTTQTPKRDVFVTALSTTAFAILFILVAAVIAAALPTSVDARPMLNMDTHALPLIHNPDDMPSHIKPDLIGYYDMRGKYRSGTRPDLRPQPSITCTRHPIYRDQTTCR